LVQQRAITGTEEAVIPDFHKPFGQRVLQETTDELQRGQRQVATLFGVAVLIPKGNLIVVDLDNTSVTENVFLKSG
jgi:hypothetical protein